MNSQQTVAHALRCLEVLEDHPARAREISETTGVPFAACTRLLKRLHGAGLIDADHEERFLLERSIDELSPLAILDAVWETFNDPASMTMLFGAPQGTQAERTQEAVAMAHHFNRFASDGGLR